MDNNKKIIIAIDGFSSCGKSTFAKAIASKIGYSFIDSGAMYRAVTLYSLENNIIEAKEKIINSLKHINIEFKINSENGNSGIYLNGKDVENAIRTMNVSENVSFVSSIAEVRKFVSSMLQKIGMTKGIVMDGRDIGTSVFPNAELKLFMTASPKIRAIRRYEELKAKGINASLEEIEKNINERDYIDQNREESPLRKADDAIELDNSNMSIEEQMVWVENLINQRISYEN